MKGFVVFVKFPSISSFARAKKWAEYNKVQKVTYGCKVKLHGANASIRINYDGTIVAQARQVILGEGNSTTYTQHQGCSYFGFNEWVNDTKKQWTEISKSLIPGESITIYGEWSGKGVQKKDAVTKLNGKYFFVFAAYFAGKMVTCPTLLEKICPDIDNLVVLPWYHAPVEVDFTNDAFVGAYLAIINTSVEDIGVEDRFIADTFGVSGPGEGLVGVPATPLSIEEYEGLSWKAKTSVHAVKHSTKAATAKIEIPDNVLMFANIFVTDARCDQGVSETGFVDPRNTGNFIKWMWQDIQKEASEEIGALVSKGTDLKNIRRTVEGAAVMWYKKAQNTMV